MVEVISLKIRYPLGFEILPKEIDAGRTWLTVRIKNIGKSKLLNLDVQLNSLDSYYLKGIDGSEFVYELNPDEETKIPFKVQASATSSVYVSVESMTEKGEPLFVESPNVTIRIGSAPAEIQSMFVLTRPYPVPEETIKCESTIVGLKSTGELNLEFWADTPSEKFELLASMKTKQFDAGEIAKYSAEITPNDEGLYEIHAYLYDGNKRVDHKTDTIFVKK